MSGLGTYDGIFIDTYSDENWGSFKTFALAKAKTGAKITYWNNGADNEHNFDSITYEDISVSPDDNSYFLWTPDTYSMPKVVL